MHTRARARAQAARGPRRCQLTVGLLLVTRCSSDSPALGHGDPTATTNRKQPKRSSSTSLDYCSKEIWFCRTNAVPVEAKGVVSRVPMGPGEGTTAAEAGVRARYAPAFP